jgi:hypothetical protein
LIREGEVVGEEAEALEKATVGVNNTLKEFGMDDVSKKLLEVSVFQLAQMREVVTALRGAGERDEFSPEILQQGAIARRAFAKIDSYVSGTDHRGIPSRASVNVFAQGRTSDDPALLFKRTGHVDGWRGTGIGEISERVELALNELGVRFRAERRQGRSNVGYIAQFPFEDENRDDMPIIDVWGSVGGRYRSPVVESGAYLDPVVQRVGYGLTLNGQFSGEQLASIRVPDTLTAEAILNFLLGKFHASLVAQYSEPNIRKVDENQRLISDLARRSLILSNPAFAK